MGWELSKQPDGLWAIYSTITDTLIHVGLTSEEVVLEYEKPEWMDRLQRGINPAHCQTDIREALAWTHFGNNPTKKECEAPDPSDPLESAIKNYATWTDEQVMAAIRELQGEV